jgi:hypothetical protein
MLNEAMGLTSANGPVHAMQAVSLGSGPGFCLDALQQYFGPLSCTVADAVHWEALPREYGYVKYDCKKSFEEQPSVLQLIGRAQVRKGSCCTCT